MRWAATWQNFPTLGHNADHLPIDRSDRYAHTLRLQRVELHQVDCIGYPIAAQNGVGRFAIEAVDHAKRDGPECPSFQIQGLGNGRSCLGPVGSVDEASAARRAGRQHHSCPGFSKGLHSFFWVASLHAKDGSRTDADESIRFNIPVISATSLCTSGRYLTMRPAFTRSPTARSQSSITLISTLY
jgi:hypothetical protein